MLENLVLSFINVNGIINTWQQLNFYSKSYLIGMVLWFVFGFFWYFIRICFIKLKIGKKGKLYKKIESKILKLRNISKETIHAVIMEEVGDALSIQAKYFTHVNNFVLWGFLGTVGGLALSLRDMNGVFANQVSIENLLSQFQALLPKMSFAFYSTILGIFLNIFSKFLYHSANLNPVLAKLESDLVKRYEGDRHPLENVFSDFIKTFTDSFKKEFLEDFSHTVKEGFQEGVKDFKVSIEKMSDSVIGTMLKLNNISDNLEKFTESFKFAGEVTEKMSETVESLSLTLKENVTMLERVTESFADNVDRLNQITNKIGSAEQFVEKINDNLEQLFAKEQELIELMNNNSHILTKFNNDLIDNSTQLRELTTVNKDLFTLNQQLNDTIPELINSHNDMKLEMNELKSAVSELSDETTGYTALLNQIESKINNSDEFLKSVIQQVKEMTERGNLLVEKQEQLADKLNNIFEGMRNWSGSYEKMIKENENFMREQSKKYGVFVETLQNVQNTLQSTINSFTSSLNKLENVLESGLSEDIKRNIVDIAPALRNLEQQLKNATQKYIYNLEEIWETLEGIREEVKNRVKTIN